jgi:hypothetical protein
VKKSPQSFVEAQLIAPFSTVCKGLQGAMNRFPKDFFTASQTPALQSDYD